MVEEPRSAKESPALLLPEEKAATVRLFRRLRDVGNERSSEFRQPPTRGMGIAPCVCYENLLCGLLTGGFGTGCVFRIGRGGGGSSLDVHWHRQLRCRVGGRGKNMEGRGSWSCKRRWCGAAEASGVHARDQFPPVLVGFTDTDFCKPLQQNPGGARVLQEDSRATLNRI